MNGRIWKAAILPVKTNHRYVRVLVPSAALLFRDLRVHLVLDSGCMQGTKLNFFFFVEYHAISAPPLTAFDCLFGGIEYQTACLGGGARVCNFGTMKHGALSDPPYHHVSTGSVVLVQCDSTIVSACLFLPLLRSVNDVRRRGLDLEGGRR